MDKEKLYKIRSQFTILEEKINGHELVYLDNAATAQIPKEVLKKVQSFEQHKRANVHRSVDTLGYEATQAYELARVQVQNFINAGSFKEIIFTSGCTAGINLVAQSLADQIKSGDEIVITALEHHSDLLPWQQLALRKSAHLKFIELDKNYKIDLKDARRKITDKTRIVAISHVSNVLGNINPVQKIIKIAHQHHALTLVDGAQAVGHFPIDVQKLNADFYALSGHKMFAPDGIGILYGKERLLEKMPVVNFGGEMIRNVTRTGAIWAELPQKFEAGTPNISGAIGLGAAISFINKIGIENIQKHNQKLVDYLLSRLKEIPKIKIYSPQEKNTGIISFNLKNIHPHDLATALDLDGIEVRAGHHCAQPLMNVLGTEATVRVSFSIFNTKYDCDKLLASVKKAREFFNHGTK